MIALTVAAKPLSKLPAKSGVFAATTATLRYSGNWLRNSCRALCRSQPWVSASAVVSRPITAGFCFSQITRSASTILSSAPITELT
ncbi:hypothetical protein D3C85_1693230 [compost metagenome]